MNHRHNIVQINVAIPGVTPNYKSSMDSLFKDVQLVRSQRKKLIKKKTARKKIKKLFLSPRFLVFRALFSALRPD